MGLVQLVFLVMSYKVVRFRTTLWYTPGTQSGQGGR